MKELYQKPNAEWIEFEAERIMLSLQNVDGGIGDGPSLGGEEGVGGGEGWIP